MGNSVETVDFKLPKFDPQDPKKHVVKVLPVKRVRGKDGYINLQHENNFLFGRSKITLPPKLRNASGSLVSPLTQDETAYFENSELSGLPFKRGDLSVHNKDEDNFWYSREARITLTETPLELDLSDSMDYIKYKILLSNYDKICPDPDALNDSRNKQTYKFVIRPYHYEDKSKIKKFNRTKDIYRFLGKIEGDKTQMTNFLLVMYPDKYISPTTKTDTLIGRLQDAAETDQSRFIEVMEDEYRDLKATVRKAVKKQALKQEGTSYETPEGDVIGNNLKETLEFLSDPKNQELLDKIEVRISD